MNSPTIEMVTEGEYMQVAATMRPGGLITESNPMDGIIFERNETQLFRVSEVNARSGLEVPEVSRVSILQGCSKFGLLGYLTAAYNSSSQLISPRLPGLFLDIRLELKT